MSDSLKRGFEMHDVSGFALEQVTTDRKFIQVRHVGSGISFARGIDAAGMLTNEYDVTPGLQELRLGAPVDIDDYQAVNELAVKARRAAEIFLTRL
jgi:hypothetical protein